MLTRRNAALHPCAGFSLVEIAVVLLIVALLAGGALTLFKAQLSYSHTAEVREQLREARQALLNYAAANQKLPCPATDPANGLPDASCPVKGLLPWSSLGLVSTDPWGQPLHYAVTPAFTTTGFALDTPGALKVTSGGNDIDPEHAVAFVVWSVGEDATDGSSTAAANAIVVAAAGVDDLAEWTSRYALFGQMLTAGRTLPVTGSGGSSSSSSSSSSGGG